MEWNEYFITIAEQVKEKSKDINTKIGAIINNSMQISEVLKIKR